MKIAIWDDSQEDIKQLEELLQKSEFYSGEYRNE